jgi:broad specificity phosphatase PhoE
VLYGRLPDFHLSDLGSEMAEAVGAHLADHDVTLVVASSLDRAQETATPIAAAHALSITTDDRVIEAANYFEGKTFGVGDGSLRYPKHWPKLLNPFRPSWGEPYRELADRMLAAIADARAQARGHEAVIVSHQLPVWTVRSQLEGRHLWHDPRKRECSLASLTSLTFLGDALESMTYSEPAAALLPGARKTAGA